jgi:hypothetical protein
MNKPGTAADNDRRPVYFYLLTFYVIAIFLYRVMTPTHEYPRASVWWMTIGRDFLVTVGLFSLRAHGPKALLWIGMLAGIGLFLIRLNGPDSWETGHLDYWVIVH